MQYSAVLQIYTVVREEWELEFSKLFSAEFSKNYGILQNRFKAGLHMTSQAYFLNIIQIKLYLYVHTGKS